ncbi:MAG: type II toxin-antitoxin system HicB family antitoxin [bacterium]|nr:type II toxin-antitoxin system HicB family antitoxin [bacterium]
MKKREKKFIIHTKTGTYVAHIWFDAQDKAYLVSVPSLPGVITFGKTIKKAKEMARDAIELHCAYLLDDRKIIFDDKEQLVGKVLKSRVYAPVA